ncbi:MAG: type III-B CRISPR module RAMP protein Cmr4 [Gemmataceae bacterium]
MPNTRMYWLHCLSPTHAGIGRGVGYIDMPIDRDGITNWPIIRGSSFKGVWADFYKATKDNRNADPKLKAAFGLSSSNENESNSGALMPTDAKLVCLPVRSFRGTFAWVTSPLCLQMLQRTLQLAGVKDLPEAPKELPDDKAHHAMGTTLLEDKHIYLEDLDFTAVECKAATAWAEKIARWVFPGEDPKDKGWQEVFKKRFVLLPDSAFDFLCETGTEVHTRVRIKDDTKTVDNGALWTEESLPAETILMGLIQCDRVFQKKDESPRITETSLLDQFAKNPLALQIGGKATVGRGQVRCIFREAN